MSGKNRIRRKAHLRRAMIFENVEHNLELAERFLSHFRRIALVNSAHNIAKAGRCCNALVEFFLLRSRSSNHHVDTQKRSTCETK
jgi:hypothetical protein